MHANKVHDDNLADCSPWKMSSSGAKKLQITDIPDAAQCTEPQPVTPKIAVAKGNGPTMKAPHPSIPEPHFTTPETAIAKNGLNLDTPRSHKELEPQPKIPRRALADDDVSWKIREVRRRVQEKKEVLRKLKMAKTYRSRWETQDLGVLTNQWLEVCQTALEDLRAQMKERLNEEQELTLKTLLNHIGINPDLVHLNEEEDCFFT